MITYAVHIMWYEVELVEEHFASVVRAMQHTNLPVKLVVCANMQTYIEQPTDMEVYNQFTKTVLACLPDLADIDFFVKTNTDTFYNIGDFRREVRSDTGYVVWGEVDCLLPRIHFAVLESLLNDADITSAPHVVTLASRKMWDNTWTAVEHIALQPIPEYAIQSPFHHNHHISQVELDTFNEQHGQPELIQVTPVKLDGALVAFYGQMPQLIPDDMHFAREDFIAQLALAHHKIPQYHLTNVLKGHNYKHPAKRTNTGASRDDNIYKQYEQQSYAVGLLHLKRLHT